MEYLSLILSIVALVLALATLMLAYAVLKRSNLAASQEPARAPAPAPTPPPAATAPLAPAPATTTDSGLPAAPEILAAIAAAVSFVCGPNARIASVQSAGHPADASTQIWALEGRRAIYSSHNPRG